MMRKNGFTLIELVVVICITALLLSWGVPAFSTWKKKHDVEAQIVRLFNDLQSARLTAYSKKSVTGVVWTAGSSFNSYQIRTDSDNDGVLDAAPADKTLSSVNSKFPIVPSSNTVGSVVFDGKGFHTTGAVTFSIATNTGAATDCVTVSKLRIIVGKMNGTTCSPK